LFVPNATVWPGTVVGVDESETEVDVVAEGVVAVRLFEQAAKTKMATTTTEATAMDRRGDDGRIGAILWDTLGANQRLS